MRKTTLNFWVDVVLVVSAVQVLMPDVTGLEHHQWAGLALAAGFIIHLILHRKWITTVSKKMIAPHAGLPGRVRRDFWLDAILATVAFWTVCSGLAISPLLRGDGASQALVHPHHIGAGLFFILAPVHLVRHRKWLWQSIKRHVFGIYPLESPARLRKTPLTRE